MRSTALSDDPPASSWWLASDGRWYPPDVHPAAPDDEDRIAALFEAAVGVARGREAVVAPVRGERRSGPAASGNGNDTHLGTQHVGGGRRSSDRVLGVRFGPEPQSRFRTRETPNWPYEARDPSATSQRPKIRQRPGKRDRPEIHKPSSWS